MAGRACGVDEEWLGATEQTRQRSDTDALYWRSVLGSLLLWSVPALLSLYCKRKMVDFFAAAAHFGRSEKVVIVGQLVRGYSVGLTKWEKLSFFRTDLLIALVVVPACMLLVRRFLARRVALA